MRSILTRCRGRRKDICLLAAGMLQAGRRESLERHLAACGDCQQYRVEILGMTAPLAGWESELAPLQPIRGWRGDEAGELEPRLQPWRALISHCWEEWVRPNRRVWCSLAAMWLLTVCLNIAARSADSSQVTTAARPSPEMVRAYLRQEGLLAGS